MFGRKCLVGLVDKAAESLRRYERFFGWDTKIPNSAAKDKCVRQYLEVGDKRKEHPNYVGTAAWETLRKKNEYDEILYEYAKNLYDQQSTIYEKIPKWCLSCVKYCDLTRQNCNQSFALVAFSEVHTTSLH